jgi:hypothetical protein
LARVGIRLTLVLLKISQVVQKLKWKITADDLLNPFFFTFEEEEYARNLYTSGSLNIFLYSFRVLYLLSLCSVSLISLFCISYLSVLYLLSLCSLSLISLLCISYLSVLYLISLFCISYLSALYLLSLCSVSLISLLCISYLSVLYLLFLCSVSLI